MAADHSLLAHLVPKLTRGVEDAATDALAFILNRSEACRADLAELVSDGDRKFAPLTSAKTQVSPTESERLDLVAWDSGGSKRLIIESKFWAPLLDGQARRYVEHLADDGPAVLLFVVPETRRETLWGKIREQFEAAQGMELSETRRVGQMPVADIAGSDKRVAMTTWRLLLDRLKSADETMADNVLQLRGLADAQDELSFAPLHAEDFDTAVPRQILSFNRIVWSVINRGVDCGRMSVEGLKAAPQYDGYLKRFAFRAEDGKPTGDVGLCVNYSRWARSDMTSVAVTTPLWLRIWSGHSEMIDAVSRQGDVDYDWDPGDDHMWIPVRLPTGVELNDVVADVLEQLERVREIVLLRQPQGESRAEGKQRHY